MFSVNLHNINILITRAYKEVVPQRFMFTEALPPYPFGEMRKSQHTNKRHAFKNPRGKDGSSYYPDIHGAETRRNNRRRCFLALSQQCCHKCDTISVPSKKFYTEQILLLASMRFRNHAACRRTTNEAFQLKP